MNDKQRKKYEAEKRKQERMQADLEAERLLIEEMEFTKQVVKTTLPQQSTLIERLRGLIRLEEGDLSQDFELVVNCQAVTLKPMKNHKSRLRDEDLGFLIYGRNVSDN